MKLPKESRQWKHEASRIARWLPLQDPTSYSTLRRIAKAIGVILWDATISLRDLAQEADNIQLLRQVAKKARRDGWDKEPGVDFPRERLEQLGRYFTETILTDVLEQELYAASDASGAGYGYIVWHNFVMVAEASRMTQQSFPRDLQDSIIYLKEMFAAVMVVPTRSEDNPADPASWKVNRLHCGAVYVYCNLSGKGYRAGHKE